MSLQVTHLSVALTIGGNSISLVSELIPGISQGKADPTKTLPAGDAAKNAKEAIKKRMNEGMTFAMEPGVMISVSIGDIVSFIKDKFKPKEDVQMPALIGAMTSDGKDEETKDLTSSDKLKALDGLIINLWGLSLSTKGNFTFNMRLDITKDFYDGLGVPKEVTNIITVDSLGIGIVYTPKSQETASDQN